MRTEAHENGAVAEMKAKLFLTEEGYSISTPLTEERYDFIVDFHDYRGLVRVQVKRGYYPEKWNEEKLAVDFRAGWKNSPYQESDVDAFVVYNPKEDELYWLWYDEAPDSNTCRNLSNWKPHDMGRQLQSE